MFSVYSMSIFFLVKANIVVSKTLSGNKSSATADLAPNQLW